MASSEKDTFTVADQFEASSQRLPPYRDAADDAVSGIYKTRYLSAAFFMLFGGFIPAQNVTTSLFPAYGTISLGLIYFTFTLSSWLAPLVISTFRERVIFVASGVGYTVWLVSTLLRNTAFYLVASALLGLSAGPLWVTQGVYVAQCMNGRNTDDAMNTFYLVFYSTLILSNLLGGVVLIETGLDGFIGLLIAFSCVAIIMFCFVPPSDRCAESHVARQTFGWRTLMAPFALFKTHPSTWYVIVLFFWFGCNVAYGFATFNGLVFDLSGQLSLLPFVALSFGISLCAMLCLMIWKFEDVSMKLWIAASFLLNICPMVLTVVLPHVAILPLYIIGAGMLGMVEALNNSIINHMIIKLYPDQLTAGFSLFRVTMSFSIGLWALLSGPISATVLASIGMVIITLSSILLLLVDRQKSTNDDDTI